jgi:hypothetical protein
VDFRLLGELGKFGQFSEKYGSSPILWVAFLDSKIYVQE